MISHPINDSCRQRMADLERRVAQTEASAANVLVKIAELSTALARLEGRMAGYLVAASILAGALSTLAAVVVKLVMH